MDMYSKIKEINQVLANLGAGAVQKKPGLGNRPALYGFLPQIVFDAVNQVIGPENWSSIVNEHFPNERQIVVLVTVKMFETEHTQFGESQIVVTKSGFADQGSAYKGAVTDATQKCLALYGIGSAAYRGELKDVFNGKVSHVVTEENPLLDAAKAIPDKETGRTWWKENLAEIKQLGQEARDELVQELEGKK